VLRLSRVVQHATLLEKSATMNATDMQPASLKSLATRVLQCNQQRNHDATTPKKPCNFYPEKTPQKLHTVAPELQPETGLDLWRWFTLEADRVFRSSPKSTDSRNLHRGHRNSAERLCRAGDISAARVELEKALAALQGATLTQQNLI